MDDKRIEESINKALKENLALPTGLSERLERNINAWADEENRMKSDQRISRTRSLYWLSGIAAAILCAVLFIFTETGHPNPRLADTYSDPKEAAVAAENALALISSNLNKGLVQVNDARQEMNKINKIVNKHLNDE